MSAGEHAPGPAGLTDVDAAWVERVMASHVGGARVAAVTVEPVGTGQVADTARITVAWDPPGAGPASLVAKVPAADDTSRTAAAVTRTYEIEASFYAELADQLGVRTPECFHAVHDPGTGRYAVVLEDVAPARQGDQMAGCSLQEAVAALEELAELHSPRWGDPSLADIAWLHRWSPESAGFTAAMLGGFVPGFCERYGDRLEPDVLALLDRFAPRIGEHLLDVPGPWTVVHGDFRADNLLFGAGRVVVVDWQTVSHGPPAGDLAYFIGASLPEEVRRAEERALVGAYVDALAARGVEVDPDDIWREYRRRAFGGLLMAVGASMLVARTDRGDEMFVTMANRHGTHVLDLESESLIGA